MATAVASLIEQRMVAMEKSFEDKMRIKVCGLLGWRAPGGPAGLSRRSRHAHWHTHFHLAARVLFGACVRACVSVCMYRLIDRYGLVRAYIYNIYIQMHTCMQVGGFDEGFDGPRGAGRWQRSMPSWRASASEVKTPLQLGNGRPATLNRRPPTS